MLTEGKIDCLFTMTSLAYGVNTPTKSVLLYDLTLSDGKQSNTVDVYLYLQMAGRAGRMKTRPGNYGYHSEPHPWMHGTVVASFP
jgi:replicative superfamily II helicase